ncbi:hypothetical protein [Roseomonas sp. KE0001]|uniref:hypothetical protein n=1 Tax=unclassified Roseomonas TaxID=2617492 RepID=UPI0018DF8225|nr:hypothetical protein [Roseomonas sp. KE0001]MBI0436043.1 hypothetical protein [Roseomonas sp. KE0001]
MMSPLRLDASEPVFPTGPALSFGEEPEQAASRETAEAAFVRRCLMVALFASIFLQRFGLPAGDDSIALNLIVTLVVMLLLALRGAFVLDPVRTAMFFVLATVVSLSLAMNAGAASVPSMALMLIIYAPFIFSLRSPEGVLEGCVRAFQKMVLVCAVLGVAQYVAQFFMNSADLFTFSNIVPKEFLLPNFNTANPLTWDSPYFKSNGFFLLEPSTFSQYLAIAIILELLFFGATWRLLLYFIALPTSYSGTGLILLLFLLPWVLLHRRAYGAIAAMAAVGVLALVTGGLWNADALLNRINEFGSDNSSATARFIAGAWLIGQFLLSSAQDVLFGLGPGSYAQHAKLVPYEAHDPAWAKILFEYGLLGSAVFWPFFLTALFRASPSGWISTAMLIGYMTFGGMLLDPRLQILILIFCVLPKRPAAVQDSTPPGWAPLSTRPAL